MGNLKLKIEELNNKTLSIAEIINLLLYLILCVLPLIITGSGDDRYYYPKVLFLWGIGTVILLLMIKDKARNFNLPSKIYFIFFGLILLSTIKSPDVYSSVIGRQWRWEGIITFFMYGVIFIASSKYIVLKKSYVHIFMISGLIVSIYVIMQGFGIEPLGFLLNGSEIKYGTIGNRNFLSSYILIFLALAISRYIFWNDKKSFVYSLFYFATLIFSMTRGGWLTLVLICLIGLIFIIKDWEKLKRAIIVVVSFIIVFGFLDFAKGGQFLMRAGTIAEDAMNVTEDSGSGRIGIYIGAINIIKDNPILGTGVEAFWDGFKESAPQDIVEKWEKNNLMVDKAHNELLNYAATTGIPSVMAYLAIIILIGINLLKNIKDDKIKTIFIILSGYIIQANLNISMVCVAPLFWIILGIGTNIDIIKNIELK